MELQFLTKWVEELEEENIIEFLDKFMNDNPSQEDAQKVVEACQKGMAEVGEMFEKGEYFVGDLIFAGKLLTDAINLLKPALGNDASTKAGSIVLGTVYGDLHNIGKNIFKRMVEVAGFQVIDIGIDQPVSTFVNKVKEVKPDIVGMSGVLTLSLEAMKNTVDGLKEAGLRDSVKIIIGGNPVTREACDYIGADAFTKNAAEGAKICQGWMT